ncbi:MAG: hypothetical protein WBW41_14815 [Verrucomicrobiia bacterium]
MKSKYPSLGSITAPSKTAAQPVTNRAAPTATAATEDPVHAALEQSADRIPSVALEAFFAAVGAIMRMASKRANVKIDFQHAWELCKKQHPDLWTAAFGADDAEVKPADSTIAAKAATDDIREIANRVATLAGKDFQFGWRWVQETLPKIYNRQFSSSRLPVAKLKEEIYPGGIQKRAGKLFEQVVRQEQTQNGITYRDAFVKCLNREHTLVALSNYQMTPDDAFSRQPELRAKLLPLSSGGVSNRVSADPATVRVKAQQLFGRLVRDEQAKPGVSYTAAYQRVMNRETTLCDLIDKKVEVEQALAADSTLRERLA